MKHKQQPVFFDQTGVRWWNVERTIALCLALVIAAAAFLVPPMLHPVRVSSDQPNISSRTPSVSTLERQFNAKNTPIIGSGQFIRAVHVDQHGKPAISDVFTGKHIRTLTDGEAAAVGDDQYAIERYGQLRDHQMVLTFDDGPDPVYTSQILDLLSEQKVPAAFFVVGTNVVKHPELAQRMVREGHIIANHTFSHIDFEFVGMTKGDQEITQTQRAIRATTNHQTAYIRVPYAGNTDESQRDNIRGILQAQRLGYTEVSFDYDTDDWKFKSNRMPDPKVLDGTGKIVLLHDSGGNRKYTVNYLKQFIQMAKKAGYTFVGLDQAYPGRPLQTSIAPKLADRTSYLAGRATLVWPVRLVWGLFAFSVLLAFSITGLNIALAYAARRRSRHAQSWAPKSYRPKVTVLVPAYNEEKVLEGSVRSLLASTYKRLSVIIIDDGSKDATFTVARELAAKYQRVMALHQPNRGKAAALNYGLRQTDSEIIISIDADTVFETDTVGRLVAHFYDTKVGAVAGTVRVGNIRNMLTRWQALEYITSIAIERAAQAFLGAITVVPGACGAWRRAALQDVGGFSDRTLAEDCDMALLVQEAGYSIVQDVSAVGRTECPISLSDLAKQRFRWIFGDLQAYWKHRGMFFKKRYGWLGWFVLPTAVLTLLLPLIFWPLLIGVSISNIMAGRWWMLLVFPLTIMLMQTIVAIIGLRFAGESMRHLSALPLTRLVYTPLRTYILYRSLLTVLHGRLVGWSKVKRTNTVKSPQHAQSFPGVRQAAEE